MQIKRLSVGNITWLLFFFKLQRTVQTTKQKLTICDRMSEKPKLTDKNVPLLTENSEASKTSVHSDSARWLARQCRRSQLTVLTAVQSHQITTALSWYQQLQLSTFTTQSIANDNKGLRSVVNIHWPDKIDKNQLRSKASVSAFTLLVRYVVLIPCP